MEQGLTKNAILSELSRSPHGKLIEYVTVGKQAATQEAEFFAHLIAWDAIKGQVRDAKVALPIVSMSVPSFPDDLTENSLAHLARLGPRELLRAFRFGKEIGLKTAKSRRLYSLVRSYLKETEKKGWSNWQHMAIVHRHTLRELYSLVGGIRPTPEKLNICLFGQHYDKTKAEPPKGSIFEKVQNLKDMTSVEAAGTILEWQIPFLTIQGALGSRLKDPDICMAMIKGMSPTQLVTNINMLEKLGMKANPALMGAYQEGLQKAAKSTKNVLKTTRAAEAVSDPTLKANLQGLQDKQLQSMAIEGNWLVLADRSGSMREALPLAREVSAVLAKMVKGKVWLVFFDTSPQTMDVTGCSLDVIKEKTKHIGPGGSTSIGCGLQRMLDSKEEIDGIAIVSDAGENHTPYFPDVYKKYSAWSGKEVPVYLYVCDGDHSMALVNSMQKNGYDMQVFDMNSKADYYSLSNLIATMRTNRYSLIDEINATPLLTLDKVFKQLTTKEAVNA